MSSEEGNLFANVLKKPQQKQRGAAEEEKQGLSQASSLTKQNNMFSKVRPSNSATNKGQAGEEEKKEGSTSAQLDSLFASAPAGRTSQMGQMKRGLSNDFMSSVNMNNLVSKGKEAKEGEEGGLTKGKGGRVSVNSNIALFQGTINQSSARGGGNGQDSQQKIKKVTDISDVGSVGRSSVKDLIMKFNTGVSQNDEEPFKAAPGKQKKKKKNVEGRVSIGDAFMQTVNRATDNGPSKDKRAESQGFRLIGKPSGRLSIGDSFVVNAAKNQESDQRDSQLSAPRNQSKNIFSKVRAIQASSKLSVRSEPDQQTKQNIFKKSKAIENLENDIVNRDDGGIGANLISMDQMANNLVRAQDGEGRKSIKKERTKKLREEDTLQDQLDQIEAPNSKSPEPRGVIFALGKEERPSTLVKKPFDLSNQLKELQSNAQEQRSQQDNGSIASSQNRSRLKIKQLGSIADRDRDTQSLGKTSNRSLLTADIIVYKSLVPELENTERLVEKKNEEFEGVQMAATAAPQAVRNKARQELEHQNIGNMVAAQEREHQSSAREFKIEHAKQGAKKVSKLEVKNNAMQLKSQNLQSMPYDRQVENEEDKQKSLTNNSNVALNKIDSSEDKPQIVSSNISNLFVDGSAVKQMQSDKRSKQHSEHQSLAISTINGSHSKKRNNDFVEFVIGGDSLMPKRVRSKKSDLPYSNYSGNSERGKSPSGGTNILEGLQAQLALEDSEERNKQTSDRGRPKKSRGQSFNAEQLGEDLGTDEDGELGKLEDEETRKLQAVVDKAAAAFMGEVGDDCNADESTPDEDDDDLDEVERRIAEQEQMLNDVIEGAAVDQDGQAISSFNAEVPNNKSNTSQAIREIKQKQDQEDQVRSKQILARFLDSSKEDQDSNMLLNSGYQGELEELQKAEQRKLEEAIQQAYEGDAKIAILAPNNRSNLEFETSNIKNSRDNSRRRPETVLKQNAPSRLSGMHNVSDITDPHALRNNYLEQSQMDQTDQSTSVMMEKNKREQQLRYELEILELELELQMNEAQFSDEDSDLGSDEESDSARLAYINNNNTTQLKKSASGRDNCYDSNINSIQQYGGEMDGTVEVNVNSFMHGQDMNNNSLDDPRSRLHNQSQLGPNGLRSLTKMQSALTSDQHNADVSSQWGNRQQRHQKIVMPINLEDQEVLCSNCYETIPMHHVDKHSATCFKDEPSFRQSQIRGHPSGTATVDEETDYRVKSEELNERIFKLIQTFLRKLDSQVFLDQIYTTHGNEDMENSGNQPGLSAMDEERGGKLQTSSHKSQDETKNLFQNNNVNKFQPNKSATALAEERSLIHEVVQHAHQALQGELHDVQNSAEQLDELEEEHDLNQKFEFNNHMVYNRIVQVINIKLEVMQGYEKKANPDIVVPLTSKQIRERDEGFIGENFGFQELNRANIRKLPLGTADQRNSESQTDTNAHKRQNSQERQLNDYIQASRAQALQQRKKKNIFQNKKSNAGAGGVDTSGVAENWILSDVGSDTYSAGGDSHSSFNSFSKPRFQSTNILKNNLKLPSQYQK